jgi:hypothetical protein
VLIPRVPTDRKQQITASANLVGDAGGVVLNGKQEHFSGVVAMRGAGRRNQDLRLCRAHRHGLNECGEMKKYG